MAAEGKDEMLTSDVAMTGRWVGMAAGSPTFTWCGYRVRADMPLPALEPAWRSLEAGSSGSVFQSWHWTVSWCDNVAPYHGEQPLFVTLSTDEGVAAILPFGIRTFGTVQVLTWLGQWHASYGLPLAGAGVLEALALLPVGDLVAELARRAGAAVVYLDRQPMSWGGVDNPFARCRRAVRTANDTFVVALDADFGAQQRRLFSGRALSTLNRKSRKLAVAGATSYEPPADGAERAEALSWFLEIKRDQLAREGKSLPFDAAGLQRHYLALLADGKGLIVDQIRVGDERIAVGLSALAGETCHLINAAYADGTYAPCSPGALLLHRMIGGAQGRGHRRYDLGPGALAYKEAWQPERIALTATCFIVQPKGVLTYLALLMGVRLKSAVKQSRAMCRLAGVAGRCVLALRRLLRPAYRSA